MVRLATGIALLGLLSVTQHAFGADSAEATGERMSRFYLTPTRQEFDDIQKSMKSNLKMLEADEKKNGSGLLAAVFLARVAEKYQYPLLDIGHLDDTAKSIMTSDGSKVSNYVHDDSQVDPGKLDVWWVSYFATGETKYLDNILAQVADLKSKSGVSNLLVAGAANWSVSSNCKQHPAVVEYVRSVLARTPPPANAEAIRARIPGAPVASSAECAPEKMVRITFRDASPEIDKNSFAAKPKTLYRLGNGYGRIEEEPDTKLGIHGLMVVNEPDIWMVNQYDKSGKHVVDGGPKFDFKAPIIQVKDLPAPLRDLEFGCELAFIKANAPTPSGQVDLGGGLVLNKHAVIRGDQAVALLVRPQDDKIFAVAYYKDGKLQYYLRYLEYEVGLTPDPKMFEKPEKIQFTEAGAD